MSSATENISRMVRGDTPLIAPPGSPAVMSIVADTAFDLRQYSVEGPSGFLNVGPPSFRPRYHPGQWTLIWADGCRALLFSAEDPEVTRGASGSFFWWDELAKARRSELGWSNMMFGMREGNPRGIVTTTPKPVPILKKLIKAKSTFTTTGSTWDNRSNLSEVFYREVIQPSKADLLSWENDDVRRKVLSSLTEDQIVQLTYDWEFWGRGDQQLPPGDWFIWLILTGRGWGKTRTAVENISKMVRGDTPLIAPPGAPAVISIVADTAFDLRQYSVEGPSGFMNVGPPSFRPRYHPGQSTLIWPNGTKALLFSAEDPEVTRGASGSFFWWDELAKARRGDLGWSNMLFGMREGNPRGIVTTTPKPVPILKKLLKAASTFVTTGSTWDNRSNLSEIFYKEVVQPLEGTRQGRQEINAEMIDDLPGALWTRAMIDKAREPRVLPDFNRVIVSVDPSGARTMADNAASNIGIVVTARGVDGRGYVLADRSCKMSPAGWGARACAAYHARAASCRHLSGISDGRFLAAS